METENKFHIKPIGILCSGFVVFLACILFIVPSLNSQVIEKSETVETSAEPATKAIEEKKDFIKHEYIGADQCLACHENRDKSIRLTKHTILFKKANKKSANGCEACHGAGSAHMEDPEGDILNFNKDADPANGSAACLKCHRRGDVKNWDVSNHAEEHMNCVDCHKTHEPAEKQLKAQQTELCGACHNEKKMEILMPGRHPIKEGKATCSQCHSPHGNFEMAYDGSSVTLSCAGCHQEKTGPFAFEHEPAAESCINCHQVHGSPNKKLLKFKVPELCIQCHTGLHNVPNSANNISKKCTDCHTAPHGSNLDQELLR